MSPVDSLIQTFKLTTNKMFLEIQTLKGDINVDGAGRERWREKKGFREKKNGIVSLTRSRYISILDVDNEKEVVNIYLTWKHNIAIPDSGFQ